MRFKLAAFAVASVLVQITLSTGYVLNVFRDNSTKRIQEYVTIAAEQTEGLALLFFERQKVRAADWASDGRIRQEASRIAASRLVAASSPDESVRAEAARDAAARAAALREYLLAHKLPLDGSVAIVDLLDLSGAVLASTASERVGHAEGSEENEPAGSFGGALAGGVGSAFVGPVLLEDEYGRADVPVFHVYAPVFGDDPSAPVGILSLHVLSRELDDLLAGRLQERLGAKTGGGGRMESMEAFLVDRRKLMSTPSIFVADAVGRQAVDTEPVRRCLESGEETVGSYADYRGVQVFGASMCPRDSWWMLLVEVDRDVALSAHDAAAWKSATFTGLIGLAVLAGALFLSGRMGKRVRRCAETLERVGRGDFGARTGDDAIDEIGMAARGVDKMAQRLDGYFGSINHEYATVFNNSPIGICTVLSDGTVSSCNPRMDELLAPMVAVGLAGTNLLSTPFFDEIGIAQRLREALAAGTAFEQEALIANPPASTPAVIRFRCLPVKNGEERVGRFILMAEDVTRQAAEKQGAQQHAWELEREVANRTAELRKEKEELERANRLLVGRELRMVELKKRLPPA